MAKRLTLVKPDKPVSDMTPEERRALAKKIQAAMLVKPKP